MYAVQKHCIHRTIQFVPARKNTLMISSRDCPYIKLELIHAFIHVAADDAVLDLKSTAQARTPILTIDTRRNGSGRLQHPVPYQSDQYAKSSTPRCEIKLLLNAPLPYGSIPHTENEACILSQAHHSIICNVRCTTQNKSVTLRRTSPPPLASPALAQR